MDPVLDIATVDSLPRPLTLVQHTAIVAYNRTGNVPYWFQMKVALALYEGRDVVCIAGTGSGKSIAFILPLFMCSQIIIWIVSPLNFIENQMASNYSRFGLSAVAVNASTLTPTLLSDIKKGRYQVIISSPEAYKDANKLRGALLSKELKQWRHITVVDEAHVIHTWANNDFRVVYQRIGDMRVYMPKDSPMCAATATCSPKVKDGIVKCLHINKDHEFVNLGNWRQNLCYGLHVMRGGKRSYGEIKDLFPPPPESFESVPQALIFVEDYATAYWLAAELQSHYGLEGDDALRGIAVYHSLIDEMTKNRAERLFRRGTTRIMICTEALTMGVDFSSVEMVINYLSPESEESWCQRAGRGARLRGISCLCIIMVTKRMVREACSMCDKANIPINRTLAKIKVEEHDNEDEDRLEDEPSYPAPANSTLKVTGRPQMSLGMAEYIATADCRTQVLDRLFDNPEHRSCYEVGGCDLCIEAQQSLGDIHQERRHAIKQETQELSIQEYDGELEHKKKVQRATNIRVGQERERFARELEIWRKQKLLELLDTCNISSSAIMTQKALERIAKTKGISQPSDFDRPKIAWPGQLEWREQVIKLLDGLQQTEDQRLEGEKQAKAEVLAEKSRKKQEEQDRKNRIAMEAKRAKDEAKQVQDQLKTQKNLLSREVMPPMAATEPSSATPRAVGTVLIKQTTPSLTFDHPGGGLESQAKLEVDLRYIQNATASVQLEHETTSGPSSSTPHPTTVPLASSKRRKTTDANKNTSRPRPPPKGTFKFVEYQHPQPPTDE